MLCAVGWEEAVKIEIDLLQIDDPAIKVSPPV
jgi:hypothetical protein